MRRIQEIMKGRFFLLLIATLVVVSVFLFLGETFHKQYLLKEYLNVGPSFSYTEKRFDEFESLKKSGRIKESIFLNGSFFFLASQTIYYKLDNGSVVWTAIPSTSRVSHADELGLQGTVIGDKPLFPGSLIILQVSPFLLFIIIILYTSSMAGRLGGIIKGKVRGVTSRVTFADVGGIDEAVAQTKEAIEFLKNPAEWQDFGEVGMGAILYHGPPGCGKTHLARAAAGEAGVPFFAISAANVEGILIGAGVSKIDEFFDILEKNAPAIGFIDEFESVARHRGGGFGEAASRSYEQTTNEILHRMDGIFEQRKPVLIMAATNRLDLIDEAVIRAGRFGNQIFVGPPDPRGREAILRVHAKGRPLAPDVDFKKITKLTPGFTGAFLKELTKAAARKGIKRCLKELVENPLRKPARLICQQDYQEAISVVLHGIAKELDLSDKEKEVGAVHEAGHALVGRSLPSIPLAKEASIIPRERSLGRVWAPLEKDKYLEFAEDVMEEMTYALAGRAAEKIFYKGSHTGGATNDLREATRLARKLVYEYRFPDDDDLGPQYFGDLLPQKNVFSVKTISDTTSAKLEIKVSKMLNACADRAYKILSDEKFKTVFEELRKELISEKELDEEQLGKIWEKVPDLPNKR